MSIEKQRGKIRKHFWILGFFIKNVSTRFSQAISPEDIAVMFCESWDQTLKSSHIGYRDTKVPTWDENEIRR